MESTPGLLKSGARFKPIKINRARVLRIKYLLFSLSASSSFCVSSSIARSFSRFTSSNWISNSLLSCSTLTLSDCNDVNSTSNAADFSFSIFSSSSTRCKLSFSLSIFLFASSLFRFVVGEGCFASCVVAFDASLATTTWTLDDFGVFMMNFSPVGASCCDGFSTRLITDTLSPVSLKLPIDSLLLLYKP